MSIENSRRKHYGVKLQTADEGLLSVGSIAFSAGDTLTTEKKTSAIELSSDNTTLHPDTKYQLIIDKPANNTAGDLTIKVYNVSTVDGTNARDCLLADMIVSKVTDVGTFKCFNIEGLFIGDGTIKISATFATNDSNAITVYYKLFRF